jgi:DNA replication protein DnaC
MACDKCNDSGFMMVERDGRNVAQDCECRAVKRLAQMIRRAGLPERYAMASLDQFALKDASASVKTMHHTAMRYVEEFPTNRDKGLLLSGSVGTGKTHVAIGILRELAMRYGVRGYFTDFRELLKRIQNTFNNGGMTREQVLQPIKDAECLVIDEIAAERSTDWTFDVAEEVINWRYNHAQATILTTNLPNKPLGHAEPRGGSGSYALAAQSAMRVETLGDRIGVRMYSRLQEMCLAVDVTGEDYRGRRNR